MKILLRSEQSPGLSSDWKQIYDGTKVLEGLTRHSITSSGKDGTVYNFPRFTFPELGPARFYRDPDYQYHEVYTIPEPFIAEIAGRRWKISIVSIYDGGVPERAEVTFEETTEPETPFTTEVPQDTTSQVFGQPRFIQSEMFPQLDGKCACILAVIESDWGDAGNENLFLVLDDAGIPCGIFHEASCC